MAPSFDTAGWFTNDAELLSVVGRVVLEGGPDRSANERFVVTDDVLARTDDPITSAFSTWVKTAALDSVESLTIASDGLDSW